MLEGDLSDPDVQRFLSLLNLLERSALMSMGLIAGSGGEITFSLPEAKEAIDVLMSLQRRVAGNLSQVEERLFNALVAQLQMHFIQVPERQAAARAAAGQAEVVRQAFEDPRAGPAETVLDDEE